MSGKKTSAGWFGPKRFGFGIGPASWQGWLVMLVFVGGAVGAARDKTFLLERMQDLGQSPG